MRYPYLQSIPSHRERTEVMGGYHHSLRISDGEFYDMENLSSDRFPVLSPRKKRGLYASPAAPGGMIGKDALCYVDGSAMVIDQYRLELGLSTAAEDCPKNLISMGAYILILPDKKYVNTADLSDYGSMEAEFTTTAPVGFSLCREDGTAYDAEYVQPSAPEKPANMALWVDTSSQPHALKQYSESTGLWSSLHTVYIRISSPGIGKAFDRYDGIVISGLEGSPIIDNATGEAVGNARDFAALEGSNVIWDKGDDFLTVIGMLDRAVTIRNKVTVSRKMPRMDFVIESGNRLWGCRYGQDEKGQFVNQIYASKAGSFKNWGCYQGLATDSYFVNLGSDGPFTGAVNFRGYPCFFKERMLHKVYGKTPDSFGLQDTALRGVQKGCGRSLAIVNEVLYYKSRGAVVAYDGSLPVEVSKQLGEIPYSDAVAEAFGDKYYISMKDPAGHYSLFVLDTARRLWHREDDLHAEDLCACRDEVYAVDGKTKKILTLLGSGEPYEDRVRWYAQTGNLGMGTPEGKYIARLQVRMSMAADATAEICIRYDGEQDFQKAATLKSDSLRTFSVPIRVRRCDHFQLLFRGTGDCRIYSVTRHMQEGSDWTA